MKVRWLGHGRVEYFLKLKCPEDKDFSEIKIAKLYDILQPAFEKAEMLDTISKLGTLLSTFILTCISPIIGDEIVAGVAGIAAIQEVAASGILIEIADLLSKMVA